MDLLSKSDAEIFEIGKPYWENLVRSSNLKDYGGFTRDFSTQMLFGANEVELGKQWANNKLITNLKETYDPFGTLRRGEHITVLIKVTNKEIPGEFLGRLVLGVEDEIIKVFGATIYWSKNIYFIELKFDIFFSRCIHFYMPEIIKKLPLEIKKNKLKTGVAVLLSAYWGVIIVGTLISF